MKDKIPQQLLITGGKSWRSKPILERINSEFPERIKLPGNVPQDDMAAH